jgi:hypothetical protein
MIAWEAYGNRWRLHPGVSDTIARAIRQEGLAMMCGRIGVDEIALETAAYAGIARPETVEAIRAWLR